MKKYVAILLFSVPLYSFSQFAIISDKDGFVNVRQGRESNSKITGRLKNGHLVYCFENNGNWTNIDYSEKANELNGYIFKDRYKLISGFLAIPVIGRNKNSIKLKRDSIEVTLTQRRFERNKHKFTFFKENASQIELIDNRKYWGTDGGMPTMQFDKIIVKCGYKMITLPKEATEGLYEPNLFTAAVNFDKHNNTIYLQTMNSDGAGSYEIVWKIENGIYKDRFIAYGF